LAIRRPEEDRNQGNDLDSIGRPVLAGMKGFGRAHGGLRDPSWHAAKCIAEPGDRVGMKRKNPTHGPKANR
jgi:hypothetical protein